MIAAEKPKYGVFNLSGLIVGAVAFAGILLAPTPEGMSVEGQRAGAVAALMAIFWLSEAIPLAATALIPIAAFPLLGVIKGTEVTLAYGDANIFLFAGGFFIAMAMQKWNLHERIALLVVKRAGTNMNRLVLGFMVATAFLSFWISNTATVLMMVPIAAAITDQMERTAGAKAVKHFAVCLLLGIAYASSIGGVGTLIGTPPNIVLKSQYAAMFPDAPEIGFVQWMAMGVPFVLLFIPVTWYVLTRFLFRIDHLDPSGAQDEIDRRLAGLGPMSRGERIVAVVSVLTALSWIFRADIDLAAFIIPGWSRLFPNPEYIHDSTVALFYAVLLFLIPVDWKKGEFALDWEWAVKIPWGILILFGGGIALAKGFQASGLVEWIGGKLALLDGLPPFAVLVMICLLMTFLTELTSNTGTTNIMMPILGGAAAPALGMNPLFLMLPAAISASCAFMLPVATPPNAIIFGSGRVTVPQMARAGLAINLIGVVLVSLIVYFIAVPVFGIDPTTVPAWAGQP